MVLLCEERPAERPQQEGQHKRQKRLGTHYDISLGPGYRVGTVKENIKMLQLGKDRHEVRAVRA